jgi:tight adherence protein B
VRKLALLGVAALVAVVAVLPAGAAQSGPTLSESAARFPDRYYFLTLPKPQRLTAGNVRVTENGAPVTNLAVTRPGEQGFVTYLVIDASNSMRGKPIADAMKAARAFAARRNPNSPLGVIFFNDNVTVALKPTRDRQDINEVLAKPPALREKTHLYDALDKTADELEAAGAPGGAIVLLSDGDDVGSKATQEVAVTRLKEQTARVFGVGLRSGAYTPDALQTFAAETGGSYAETGQSAQLTAIFDALGFKLSNEYLLLWRSQAGPEKKINVAVRVAGYPQPVTTSYTTPSLGLTIPPLDQSLLDRLVKSWFFMLLIVVAVVGLVFWGVRTAVEARQRNLRARMAMFVDVGGHGSESESQVDMAARLDRLEESLEKRGFVQRFAENCDIADIQRPPGTLLLGSIILGLVGGLVLASLWTPWALFLIPAVPLALRWWVRFKADRNRRAFAEQLPDNLEVLAGALRAGHSLVGGLAVMAEDAADPSRKEFKRVVTDEQLGIPLEDALKRVGRRMKNRDMDQVALIALLQRETGGSSAEVIDQVTDNVRGRMEVRRLVRTLTAQGRLARWIVSFMPVVLILMIMTLYPAFLNPLFDTTFGIVALVVAGLMVVAGSLVIKRIIEIKV